MSNTLSTAFAKFAVAIVALAMMFSVVAPASAQNFDDMSLEDLIALVTQLQAQLGDGDDMSGGSSAAVCPYTWTRDLSAGSTGADVMALQQFLNSMPETQVAPAGSAGSAGMETSYYGPATGAAVANFQMKYRAEILTPLGLVNPTQYFGAGSRAQANDLCIADANVGDDDDMDDDDDMNDDDDDMDRTLSGEASVDTFEIDDMSDDEVEEGEEDMPVAEMIFEFTDGDAEISRIDIQVLGDGETDTDSVEPWEAFEEFSLWVDGEKVADVDASDEDEYLDEDEGTLRFTNLDIFAEEDEEVEVIIAATVMNNVDSNERGTWTISAEAFRFFDADGVATTEEANDFELGDKVNFDIVEEGDGDELDLRSSTDSPDEETIILDENSDTEALIFAFELDADDSEGDIEINELDMLFTISSTTGEMDELVDDFYVEIDGEQFDAESYDGSTSTASVTFDIDGDIVVEEGETVTVMVYADFLEMESDSEYQGVTIVAEIARAGVDAEGAEDIAVGGSDQTGDEQTLRSTGLYAEDTPSTDRDADEGIGTFEFTFELTAIEEDMFVSTTTGGAADGNGFDWTVVGGAATSTASVQSDADITDGYYQINAGDAEEFTVVVTVDPTNPGSYYVILDDVNYFIESVGGTAATYDFTPSSDWDTSAVSISAS